MKVRMEEKTTRAHLDRDFDKVEKKQCEEISNKLSRAINSILALEEMANLDLSEDLNILKRMSDKYYKDSLYKQAPNSPYYGA